MDTAAIVEELRALEGEIAVLEARKTNTLSRRCDIPLPELTNRLSSIEDRRVEIEPLAQEYNMLSDEVEGLKVSISARAEMQADLSRTERRIEALARRRQIILDLAAAAGVSLGDE